MVQCPVDGRWTRGVMRDEDDLPEPQLGDHGVEVTDLIVGGVRVAGRLIRAAPSEKIKSHDAAWRREVRRQPVVEVYVVREAVHENDRRLRSRVVSDVDPVLVALNKSLLVGHHALGTECHLTEREPLYLIELHSVWQSKRKLAATADPGARGADP